jgi:hypothetical protein
MHGHFKQKVQAKMYSPKKSLVPIGQFTSHTLALEIEKSIVGNKIINQAGDIFADNFEKCR